MKGQSGITLIALVITVIVMLILAGVAISAVTADGGIFTKANTAVNKYSGSVEKESNQFNDVMTDFNTYWDTYGES